MKKMLFLSLLLIPAAAHCMEAEPALTPQQMVHEINDLENHLRHAKSWTEISSNDGSRYLAMGRFPKHVYGYPEGEAYYENSLYEYPLKDLVNLDTAKNARYNGYSIITAVTLATDITDNEKMEIIQKLTNAGFETTEKDKLRTLPLERNEHLRIQSEKRTIHSSAPIMFSSIPSAYPLTIAFAGLAVVVAIASAHYLIY